MARRTSPLVPGMAPTLTRVLAVAGDPTLDFTSLERQGYQVTRCTDPAVAMAELQSLKFHVVMIDIYSQYPGGRGAAPKLLKWAVGETHLCAYVIKEDGYSRGPIEMHDISSKPITNVASNGAKLLEARPNRLYNTSPATTKSTTATTNCPFSGRRMRRKSGKQVHNIGSHEVEHDGEHVEMEQQQPTKNPKKSRVVWTDELHTKFVEAYDKLVTTGDAVPKKILKLMKVPTLTRENIASHLQKHRLNLQREACTDPLPRSHSITEHPMSTPQASFASPNMSRQHVPPTMMQSRHETVYDDRLGIHMKKLMTMDKKCGSDDAPPKEMYPRDDDPKQNIVCRVGNSDDNNLQEDFSDILKEQDPSWEKEFILPSVRSD